jgi:uncharacterized protein YgbK (DUF1537 family)
MPHTFKILADDLTGACDTGSAFASRGLKTIVQLDRSEVPECDVPILSTASRNDEPSVAYTKVRTACDRLRVAAGVPFYKKIDSTLRGPIAAELTACIDAGARTPGVLCPAFPEQGRTVSLGQLRAPGLRIDLASLLGDLPLDIPDASSASALDAIAAGLLARDSFPLVAGSAGLARALAARIRPDSAPFERPAGPGIGRVLLCIGSEHPVTMAQIEHFRQAGRERVELHLIRFDDIPAIGGALERMREGGIFCCGGDTAAHVCNAFGATAIEIEGDVTPGVPLGRLIGGAGHGLAVVTKSGGFGEPNTITCVVDVLSAQNRKDD